MSEVEEEERENLKLYQKHPIHYEGLSKKWKCNECSKIIDTKEVHHKCFDCLSFDLCLKCYESGKTHKHGDDDFFDKITEPNFHITGRMMEKRKMNLNEIVEQCFKSYSNRYFIGTRLNSETKSFTWNRYSEVHERVRFFAHGLSALGFKKGEMISILCNIRPQHIISWFSCMYIGCGFVPIQEILSKEDKLYLLKQTESTGVICGEGELDTLFELLDESSEDTNKIRHIIVVPYTFSGKSTTSTIKLHTFDDVVELGRAKIEEDERVKISPYVHEKDDIICIIYTSGTSTGYPKGVVFRRDSWIEEMKHEHFTLPLVVYNFLPYSHISGISYTLISFFNGGRVGLLTSSDMNNLFDDFKLIRPTVLSTVPRVLNFVHYEYKRRLASFKRESPSQRKRHERNVRKEMKTVFGGRVSQVVVGSAHCSHEVKKVVRNITGIPVYDAYGSTEVGSITHGYEIDSEILTKIVDCPELGYYTTDQRFPRGELLVKNRKSVALEYFKNEGVTREKVDENGYFRTGDIVEKRNGGKIVIIDRKNNVIKLAQGEFVAIERVEAVLESSLLVDQVLLTANPEKTVLVGLVSVSSSSSSSSSQVLPKSSCPSSEDEEEVMTESDDSTTTTTDSDTETTSSSSEESTDSEGEYQRHQLTQYRLESGDTNDRSGDNIMNDFRRIGKLPQFKLQPWEIPVTIRIVPNKFQLTGVKKKNRRKILKEHNDSLSEMFEEIRQKEEDNNVLNNDHQRNEFLELLKNLGVVPPTTAAAEEEESEEISLKQLGVESFSGILIRNQIEKLCGIKISFRKLMNMSIPEILEFSNQQQHQKKNNEEEEENEGEEYDLPKSFINLEDEKVKFLEFVDTLRLRYGSFEENLSEFQKCVANPRSILMTGSTGFLGSTLLDELVKSFPESNVCCLVRKNDKILRNHRRIKMVYGDLSLPLLGLSSEEEFEKVFVVDNEIDMIIHCGAMVNHFVDYGDHYDTNVRSLYDLLKISKGYKPMIYISSLSVFRSLSYLIMNFSKSSHSDTGRFSSDQDKDIRNQFDLEEIVFPYRDGYSGSKWVADCLLQSEVTKKHVMVLRSPLIVGDTRTGRVNDKDWLTSVICACLSTKSVPIIDNEDSIEGMDMLPVDIFSQSVVRMAKESSYYDGIGKNFCFQNISSEEFFELLWKTNIEGLNFKKIRWNEWIEACENLDVSHPVTPFLGNLRRNEAIGGPSLQPFFREIQGNSNGLISSTNNDVNKNWRKMNQLDMNLYVSWILKNIVTFQDEKMESFNKKIF